MVITSSWRGHPLRKTLLQPLISVTRAQILRGLPRTNKIDNGSEFVSKATDRWAYERGVELDISRPGKPTDDARMDSFNGKLRHPNEKPDSSAHSNILPALFPMPTPSPAGRLAFINT